MRDTFVRLSSEKDKRLSWARRWPEFPTCAQSAERTFPYRHGVPDYQKPATRSRIQTGVQVELWRGLRTRRQRPPRRAQVPAARAKSISVQWTPIFAARTTPFGIIQTKKNRLTYAISEFRISLKTANHRPSIRARNLLTKLRFVVFCGTRSGRAPKGMNESITVGSERLGGQTLLNMSNISKSFPGVQALSSVNFSLKAGEVHVLIGENGAGKSTLIKILAGAYRSDSGEIFVGGRKVAIDSPLTALKLGVSVIYQELNLNPHMPIYENIFLGREKTLPLGFLRRSKAIAHCRELLERVGVEASPRTMVSNLGIAQKQMVEIAKALSMDARIIVFDEPTSTLSAAEITKLFALIRQFRQAGCGIVYISHRLEEIFEIGDRCTILRDGQYIGDSRREVSLG